MQDSFYEEAVDRLERLRAALPAGMDGALITSAPNRRYFTGFASSGGTVLVTGEKSYLLIDSRYHEAAQAVVKSCEVLLQEKLSEQLRELTGKHRVKTLAAESETVTLEQHRQWREWLPEVEIPADSPLSGLIEEQRRCKSPRELELIRAGQEITDRTFAHILDFIKAGRTEKEIALEMEFYSRRIGSRGPSFDFIVVSGQNSSQPHGVPSDKPVEAGDFITMDFGATVKGYRSDMTRTVAVGHVSGKQREVYETVLRAQEAAFAKIRAGAACGEVDRAARELIDGSAFRGCFGHGLGHSLGLEIHEQPTFSPGSKAVLRGGEVLSVEPGIYLPGEFGVRIEDIVHVTGEGFENLVTSPKELLVL